jgi:hypothetical protein
MWTLALASCWAEFREANTEGTFLADGPRKRSAIRTLRLDGCCSLNGRRDEPARSVSFSSQNPPRRQSSCTSFHIVIERLRGSPRECGTAAGPTSKMSHGPLGRDSCNMTIRSLEYHVRDMYESTRRDRAGRWLWRLVRPIVDFRCGALES